MKKIILFLLISLLISCSKESNTVPKELFGIKLGLIFDTSNIDESNTGDLPIKKFTGSNRFLGNGSHVYFEPLKENKYFPYKEEKDKPSDKFYKTNFRLYVLPVIPDSIKTTEELNKSKLKMEVVLIEWSDSKKNKEESYYWSINMCKNFSSDIKVKPEILDLYDSKTYSCRFIIQDRELEIRNIGSDRVYFTLKRPKEIFDKKDNDVEEKIRKLNVKEILQK